MNEWTTVTRLQKSYKLFFRVTDGASGVPVDVFPKNPIVRVGQNFTFMCRVGRPLMYCSIRLPGSESGLNMNEKSPRNSSYWYAGDGIGVGQCGITIARIDDRQNGQFRCSLGFANEQTESDGFTNVTVASKKLIYFGFPVYTDIWEPCILSESLADAAE